MAHRRPLGIAWSPPSSGGAKIKKKLEVDPLHADTVRLIYRLALQGDGDSGQTSVKRIVTYLNNRRLFTRDGGRWGIGQVHKILTRKTYIGQHEFNKRSKGKVLTRPAKLWGSQCLPSSVRPPSTPYRPCSSSGIPR